MSKNFEKLQEYLDVAIPCKFGIIALTEMWRNDDRGDKNSAWQISNYLFTKLDKLDKKEGVLLYLCTITLILR